MAKISDFGTSIVTEDGSISYTDIKGTPAFMAPELFETGVGSYDGFATDVYSLGTWTTVRTQGRGGGTRWYGGAARRTPGTRRASWV